MTGQSGPWTVDKCRSCGAPIIWALTRTYRIMPIDAEPVDGGNVVIVGRGERAPRVDVRPGGTLFDDRPTYTSHFATCPDAARWRHSEGTPA